MGARVGAGGHLGRRPHRVPRAGAQRDDDAALPGEEFPAAADVEVRLGTLPGGDLLAAAVVDSRLLLWRSAGGASWTPVTPPADRADTVALAAAAGRTVLAATTPDGPRTWVTGRTG